MGVDLTVCPVRWDNTHWWLLHERISFDRNYELFAQMGLTGVEDEAGNDIVAVMEDSPVPEGKRVEVYGDEGIEVCTTTPYGDPLTFVRAKEFRKVKTDKTIGKWNLAVIRFLRALPPETPVVLWWH